MLSVIVVVRRRMAAECEAMRIGAEEVIVNNKMDEFRQASKLAKVGTSGEDGWLGSSIISTIDSSCSVEELE